MVSCHTKRIRSLWLSMPYPYTRGPYVQMWNNRVASVMPCNGSVPRIDFGGLGTGIPPVKSMSLKWVRGKPFKAMNAA